MAFDEAFGQAAPSASAFGDDDKPLDPMAGSKEGLVTVSTPRYCKPEVSLEEDELTVRLDVTATESAALMRVGLDLVAVVDVSGSMKGEKLESAKRALEFVIDKLTPLDRLCIVTFTSSAQRVSRLRSMTEAAKKELIGTVGSLKAGGGTDINSGLVKGLEVLAGRVHREARTGNIYLMSDGKNDGTSSGDATKVKPGDVGVYTFGFGAGTDHKLLGQLASNSTGGTYSNVPDGDKLSASFALLLGGLVTVVAQDVKLILKPFSFDVEKMTVVEEGSNYKAETDGATGIITISFGTIFSREVRTVLIRFKLKARKNKNRNVTATLASAQHSYAGQESAQASKKLVVKRRMDPTPPDSAGVDECSLVDEEIRRKHAQNMADVRDMARDKKLPDARDKVDEAMNDVEDMTDDSMRRALHDELKKIRDCLETQKRYDEQGDCFLISCILCHLCQRAAGRGQGKVGDGMYVTPRMEHCADQADRFEKNPKEKPPTADDDAKEEILCNPLAAVCAPIASNLEVAMTALQAIKDMLADANQNNKYC